MVTMSDVHNSDLQDAGIASLKKNINKQHHFLGKVNGV